ncbi:MAG: D-alanyl-D-alanine carboxypeptidase/D-alanyl-D-alanine-endopeptidase [Bacteroides sp.]|nr:D-alanyl-D-alanine carboxypeptidase/D-alanyl-D-alanine-endopeptidase [Bacteroides sp.]
MKKTILSSLFLLGVMLPTGINAQEAAPAVTPVVSYLDSLVQHCLPKGSHAGIYVYDMTADCPLYAYNHDKLQRPASTMKLITTITTLAQPQADEPFRTEVYYKGTVKKNTLNGDLYIVGGMDPEFNDASMDSIADIIAALPFKKVKGRIYGDVSLKDSIYWGTGWIWDDTPAYYQPYLSPLLLNRGCVDVEAEPTAPGQPAKITCTPASSYYNLVNQTATSTPDAGRFSASRNWLENGNDLIVKGNVERKRSGTVNIFGPEGFFLQTLQDRLEARGMKFEETYAVRELEKDDNTVLVLSYETPVQQVVNQLMKKSDNLNTEAMLIRLAHQSTGKRHLSAEDGLQAVRALIDSIGLGAENYRVADGCGLSNYNSISPELLVGFLRFAKSRADIYPKLYQSLPIAGVDGTLKSRMKQGTPSYNNVHAKTGTISGISCLAGYCTAANGHELVFAIMNQNMLSGRDARIFQDKVCDGMIISVK